MTSIDIFIESLFLLKSEPYIYRAALSKKLGLTITETRTVLNNLKKEGKITRKRPDKGGYWKVYDS